MLKCSHCPKEFRYNSEKKRHELSHFPHFECETCYKKFSFISALRRHQKQHKRTGNAKCGECNRTFRDDVLLKRHVKYAHTGTFTCEKCSTPFSSELALSTHMKTHKPQSERRFKCSFEGCAKTFNFSHHLKHHALTHTNDKQHYCSICGKGFIQSHHLKTHQKSHDPAGWLFCEAAGCKKKFTTDYARKRHMASHNNKPDSGISSDSNSWDASISSEDYIEDSYLCASCGEIVVQTEYQIHATKCNNQEENDSEEWPNSPFKPQSIKDPSTPKSIIERDIGDCKMALGCCIVNGENCICKQMAKSESENYDFTPLGGTDSFNDNSNKVDPMPLLVKIDTVFNSENTDMCEGCDCNSRCNTKTNIDSEPNIDPTPPLKKERAAPNIEYRIDGVIKIMDTFDDDIVDDLKKRFIPFSTCKDVVGNCLVSGGDGCLCARMMADEDQAIMAQEIDDITPKPKTESL